MEAVLGTRDVEGPERAPEAASPSGWGDEADELDWVLRAVNRVRVAHGADPLYELPTGRLAMDDGSCVLERAFEDLGVAYVDYTHCVGRGFRIEHGLGDFVRRFDAGRYPRLIER